MNLKHIIPTLCSILLSFAEMGWLSTQLHAQTIFPNPADTSLSLEEIIITASGIPTTKRETIKPTVVINRAEIERYEGVGLAQLLHAQTGVFLSNAYGAPAENRRLKLQGAGDAYTLLLLDGVPLADPSSVNSLFDLRLISLGDVRRIEIVKGSQSTLYGTDAIGGVIHIITEKPDQRGTTAGNLTVSADQYLGRKGSAGLSGRVSPNVSYRLHVSGDYSDGFSAATEPGTAGEPSTQPAFDDDGHQLTSLYGNLIARLSSEHTLQAVARQGWYRGDFDGGAFTDAPNRYRSDLFHAGISHQFTSERLQWQTGYHATTTHREFQIWNTFTEDMDLYRYEGLQHQLKSTASMRIYPRVTMLAGAEGTWYVSPSTAQSDRTDASIMSTFVNSIATISEYFSAEGGLRWNQHNEFGSQWTYSFAAKATFRRPIQISAGGSSGYKAPTLDQLYGQFGANADLKPQDSMYYFAAADGVFSQIGMSYHGQVFHREIRQLIQYDFQRGYINRNREEVWGVEGRLQWSAFSNWVFTLSGNLMKGDLYLENESGELDERREDLFVLIPEHHWNIGAQWNALDDFYVRLEMEHSSSRTDLFFNNETFETEAVTLDAYRLVHLYAEYDFHGFSIFGSVSNMFNKTITEVYGYNSYKRNISIGLRFGF